MCDFVKKLFGGGDDSSQLLGLFQQRQAATDAANAAALKALQQAQTDQQKAQADPLDNEDARRAAEAKMRRLLGAQGPGPIQNLGAAPVGYNMLMGT